MNSEISSQSKTGVVYMPSISIHLGELTLKGNNRGEFEKQLMRNIVAAVPDARIRNERARFILETKQPAEALEKLKNVFGIAWFSMSKEMPRDINKIASGIAEEIGNEAVKIETRREDKGFPKTSIEISQQIAELLAGKGKNPSVKKYEKIILVEILKDRAVVTFGRNEGLGGLPYGTSGKLLALLSGGIDSPAAAWMMMRRGCEIELLHVHAQPSNDDVKKSKMLELARALARYSPKPIRLHLASYDEFYKAASKIPAREELVVFKRFILHLADAITTKENKNKDDRKQGVLGIVTGDSVAQVASQTLHNIAAVNSAAMLPVYRPLAGMDKEQIIQIAKKIGTYGISIRQYRDCCSLVAEKHPNTRAKIEDVEKIGKKIGMKKIIEKTMKGIETIAIH